VALAEQNCVRGTLARLTERQGAARYGALIRLGELIRSHPDEKDLFQTCANELHQVVAFDGMSMFDSAANWVHWHFREPFDSARETVAVKGTPKEETVV
jgi:formate hydrogenlyase transcriptional activator